LPQAAADHNAAQAGPGLSTLFLAFSGVAISGFGGVMPFARRMLVEQRRWMNPEEFNEAYALAQLLPGGNIINMAVLVGRRFHGALGSVAAVTGLVAAPFVVMLLLAALYARFAGLETVHQGLAGLAASAAGLILAMAAKMAHPLIRRRAAIPLGTAVFAFLAAGVTKVPLGIVILVLAPLSLAVAWRRR
jgi:chromate transporter